jgi:hypothetical protein
MDHEMVAQQQMTEKYLLNELDPKARDEFEEHFFDCAECALDVHTASLFIEKSKLVLAEGPTEVPAQTRVSPKQGWFGWLRPAIAAPALATLLAVVGYQNMVTYPRLMQATAPQVLQWASVNIGTYGDSGPEITTSRGKSFLVFVRIPPQSGYSHYTAELYNPASKLEWSVPIPASTNQGQWPVAVPAADRQPGTYSLVVRGTTPSGDSVKVGQGTFELHISN